MKNFALLIDENNKLYVCGSEQSAIDWETSRGRIKIGNIETDLNIIELREYVCGGTNER